MQEVGRGEGGSGSSVTRCRRSPQTILKLLGRTLPLITGLQGLPGLSGFVMNSTTWLGLLFPSELYAATWRANMKRQAGRGSHYSCQSCGQLFAQSMAESVERSACSQITSGDWDRRLIGGSDGDTNGRHQRLGCRLEKLIGHIDALMGYSRYAHKVLRRLDSTRFYLQAYPTRVKGSPHRGRQRATIKVLRRHCFYFYPSVAQKVLSF